MMRRLLDAIARRLGYVRLTDAPPPAPDSPPADQTRIVRAAWVDTAAPIDPSTRLLHDLAVRTLAIRSEISARQAAAELDALTVQGEVARLEAAPHAERGAS